IGPDCHKVLVIHDLRSTEVAGGRSSCLMLDPALLAPVIRRHIEERRTAGQSTTYMRLSEADLRQARLRCAPRLDFTLRGIAPPGGVVGFGAAEDQGRWSDGLRGAFACVWPDDAGAKPTRVRIAAHGFVWGGREQRMRVGIDGQLLEEVVFTDPTAHKLIE